MDVVEKQKVLGLEGCGLRFWWYEYPWHSNCIFFLKKNVRQAMMTIWNKNKSRLWPKISLWFSAQETCYRREMIIKHKFTYFNILEFYQGECRQGKKSWSWILNGYHSYNY